MPTFVKMAIPSQYLAALEKMDETMSDTTSNWDHWLHVR